MRIRHIRYEILGPPRGWVPAVNVHACAHGFLVCVELAGVDPASLQIVADPRTLVIRGHRPAPDPGEEETLRMLALEIDYGPFERVLTLPLEIDPTEVTARQDNGLVWISLRHLSQA